MPCEQNAGECEVLWLLQQQEVEVREGVVGDAAPYTSCRAGAGSGANASDMMVNQRFSRVTESS